MDEKFGDSEFKWPSLVAQTVTKSTTMQETWVRSLGREDPLETGVATHSGVQQGPESSPWSSALSSSLTTSPGLEEKQVEFDFK